MGAYDPFTGGLLPPGLRLPVVHPQVRVAEPRRRAEVEHAPLEPAVEHDRRVAQGVGGDRHRAPRDLVVRDLVPQEDRERVCFDVAPMFDHDQRVPCAQPPRGLAGGSNRGRSRAGSRATRSRAKARCGAGSRSSKVGISAEQSRVWEFSSSRVSLLPWSRLLDAPPENASRRCLPSAGYTRRSRHAGSAQRSETSESRSRRSHSYFLHPCTTR